MTSTLEAEDISKEDVLFYLKHVVKRLEDNEDVNITLDIHTTDTTKKPYKYGMSYLIR